jgi:hypothetical protein
VACGAVVGFPVYLDTIVSVRSAHAATVLMLKLRILIAQRGCAEAAKAMLAHQHVRDSGAVFG